MTGQVVFAARRGVRARHCRARSGAEPTAAAVVAVMCVVLLVALFRRRTGNRGDP